MAPITPAIVGLSSWVEDVSELLLESVLDVSLSVVL